MIVLDTSAAVEIMQRTPDGMALRSLMGRNEKTISCELFRAETASVIRKFTRMTHASTHDAEQQLSETIALVDEFYPLEDLQSEALRESILLDHCTYDMFYFVLARRTGATLFTLDRKLMQLCERHHVSCISEISLEEGACA